MGKNKVHRPDCHAPGMDRGKVRVPDEPNEQTMEVLCPGRALLWCDTVSDSKRRTRVHVPVIAGRLRVTSANRVGLGTGR